MSVLKAGDSFPEDVTFSYIPLTPEIADITSCGMPSPYNASQEFKDKKVVLVGIPGAFTPTCQANHVPGYTNKEAELKAKGVDRVIFIAVNDAFVMSAWGKANKVGDDFFIFASDTDMKFSKSLGWVNGDRTARYAIIIDHGKVTYADKEVARVVDKSGVDAVMANL